MDYVLQRQNEDGGYTFARGTASNAQDTYYGLRIQRLLNAQPAHISRTVNWLRSFPADNPYGYYYVCSGLTLCGEQVIPALVERVLASRRSDGSFGTLRVGVGAPSEFHSTFMAVRILRMAGLEGGAHGTRDWLLRQINDDGGFGAGSRSNLRSTFHALASLYGLGYDKSLLRATTSYLRSCELAYGGFSVVPGGAMAYLDVSYCRVAALDLMGQRCSHPGETASHVLECFNANGGFRRSGELGISTFEDTCHALFILRKIGSLG